MPALGYNPVHWVTCNLEVPPGALDLPPDLVEEMADWTAVYNAIDRLWLDSGAHETWARAQLGDVSSAVNRRGLAVRERVTPYRHCYYWLFRDESIVGSVPLSACPICRTGLRSYPDSVIPQEVCDDCGIVTVGMGPEGRGHSPQTGQPGV